MKKTVAEKKGDNAAIEKGLYSAADCARMCGVSRRTWFRLAACAKTPASVRVGGSPRWRRRDMELWISWGCKSRQEFETRREAESC